jgi:hypothetical protein
LTEKVFCEVKCLIINQVLFDCYLTERPKYAYDSEFIANLQ